MISALFDQSLVVTESVCGELFRQFSPGRLNEHSICDCANYIIGHAFCQ